jgi:KUP system potassium uptake protein
MSDSHASQHRHGTAAAAIIGALGVVFGDIGTSPIYTLKECFSPESPHHLAANAANITGVVSLIIWALITLICVKYLAFILRADNNGEGGVLSLMALALGNQESQTRRAVIITIGVFGAALLFGDGIITPAISVLSAVEGLKDVGLFGSAPDGAALAAWEHRTEWLIAAITIVVLVVLFSVQFWGTHRVGRFFGPVTLLWFLCIGVLGAFNLATNPEILAAFHPIHGMRFLLSGGLSSFTILGSVFLAVTGGEALYADMGHFGSSPIRKGWFSIVFPALLLNYLGQGALLLRDPEAATAPFFRLAPAWGTLPLVLLATAATVIASQALITGTYSLTLTAVQLGYLPRVSIRHTSEHARGQIYIPLVNWFLMVACIVLVIVFKTSSSLAAAYGVAVTMTMLITTILFYFVARQLWQWSPSKSLILCSLFALIELGFLGANLTKFLAGGWLPLAVGTVAFILMTTWATGRRLVRERLDEAAISQDQLIESLRRRPPIVVPGTAVFMSGTKGRTPVAMLHNLKHNGSIHQRVIFLTILVEDVPWVRHNQQVDVEHISDGFWRVTGHCGFMQRPDVRHLLRNCAQQGLDISASHSTFFLGREVIVPSRKVGMALWREHLFAIASKLAEQPASYFQIPVNRVIELGQQVEI